MPYIPTIRRHQLEPGHRPDVPGFMSVPQTAGELNYAMTRLAIRFTLEKGLSYETLNAVIGAFESAKLEFNRRVVTPYEDRKAAENGDVFPAHLL